MRRAFIPLHFKSTVKRANPTIKVSIIPPAITINFALKALSTPIHLHQPKPIQEILNHTFSAPKIHAHRAWPKTSWMKHEISLERYIVENVKKILKHIEFFNNRLEFEWRFKIRKVNGKLRINVNRMSTRRFTGIIIYLGGSFATVYTTTLNQPKG